MPVKYNLSVYRGDTKRLELLMFGDTANTIPTDLTGVTALSQIRDKLDGVVVGLLDCEVVVPNIVNVVLTSDVSAALPPKGVWDLQLTFLSGDVNTPVSGTVTVTSDVTNTNP